MYIFIKITGFIKTYTFTDPMHEAVNQLTALLSCLYVMFLVRYKTCCMFLSNIITMLQCVFNVTKFERTINCTKWYESSTGHYAYLEQI